MGNVIERLEATIHAINEARAEALALAQEFPQMLTHERLIAERRRFHLRREVATQTSGLAFRRPEPGASAS
jgi:hypothetical protein